LSGVFLQRRNNNYSADFTGLHLGKRWRLLWLPTPSFFGAPMNFENRPTHSLRPYPGNARTHSPKHWSPQIYGSAPVKRLQLRSDFALNPGRRERNFWMQRQGAKNGHSNALTPAETKSREQSGRKSPQKRAIWRRLRNVRFARAGWWRHSGTNWGPTTQSSNQSPQPGRERKFAMQRRARKSRLIT
jgi:hypothetical protein